MSEGSIKAEEFQRLRAIFDAAVAQPPGLERQQIVEDSCAGDLVMLASVERLLQRDAEIAGGGQAGQLPRFGVYKAVRQLGRGGMGVVYEAERDDGHYARRVAVKVLAASTLGAPLAEAIRRERQILADFNHPGIAQLFDGGVTERGEPYLVVEHIDGRHLDDYCAGLEPDAKLTVFLAVLDAIEYAHARGIAHQDLKPSNILVDSSGQPKLVDFGAASPLHGALTATQSITPEFAAPEARAGEPGGVRGDIYSLGVLYAKLFAGEARTEVVQRATARNPAHRFPSAKEFRSALTAKPYAGRIALTLSALVLAALFWSVITGRPANLTAINPPGTHWLGASFSANGEWLAFASEDGTPGRIDIWASRADGSGARRLFSDPGVDSDPTISPDGRHIAFRTETAPAGIHEFDRETGVRRPLVPGGHQPKYSPNGRWLLYSRADDRAHSSRSRPGDWLVMPARGGPPKPVAEKLLFQRFVFWDRDGRSLLIQGDSERRGRGDRVWRYDVESGELAVQLGWQEISVAACAVDNEGFLRAIAYDGDGFRLVRYRLSGRIEAPLTSIPLRSGETCTAAGDAIYVMTSAPTSTYLTLPLTGANRTPHPIRQPEASAGWRLLGVSHDGGTRAFWGLTRGLLDVNGKARELPGAGAVSGDGRSVWYSAWSGDEIRIYRERLNPSNASTQATVSFAQASRLWDVSPDGRTALAYMYGVAQTEITLLDGDTGSINTIASHPKWNLFRGAYSPDGLWFVFTAVKENRELRMYAAPLRGKRAAAVEEWIDLGEGTAAEFALDGGSIYFLARRGAESAISRLPLDPVSKRPAGEPVVLHKLEGATSIANLPLSYFHLHAVTGGILFPTARPSGNVYRVDSP